MNQRHLFAITILGLLLLTFACIRQEINPTDLNRLTDSQLERLAIADQVGVNHNRALDYLAQKVDLTAATSEQKFRIISDFYISQAETDEQRRILKAAKEKGCVSCSFDYNSISEWVLTITSCQS
jgi:predicted DNA binding protein